MAAGCPGRRPLRPPTPPPSPSRPVGGGGCGGWGTRWLTKRPRPPRSPCPPPAARRGGIALAAEHSSNLYNQGNVVTVAVGQSESVFGETVLLHTGGREAGNRLTARATELATAAAAALPPKLTSHRDRADEDLGFAAAAAAAALPRPPPLPPPLLRSRCGGARGRRRRVAIWVAARSHSRRRRSRLQHHPWHRRRF